MRPTLFEIGGYPVHAYPVLIALALVVSVMLAVREAERRGLPISHDMGVWAFLGGFLGAKAWWIVQYAGAARLGRVLFVWEPGLVFYGGLIGGFLAASVYLIVARVPYRPALDVVAPYLALGEAIGRIGCFLHGCCWGRLCSAPWGVRFPFGSPPYDRQIEVGLIDYHAETTLPIHPTQIYMTVGLLLLFVLLKWVLNRPHLAGTVFLSYIGLHGVLRFVVERFRADSPPIRYGLSSGQVFGLALAGAALLGALAIVALRRRTTRSCHEPPADATELRD